jgi:general secretion pathway protein A
MLDLTRRAAPAAPAENRPGSATIPSSAREWLLGLLEASKEVVVDAQLVINQRGVGYKNFIPATFGSQAALRFSRRSPVRLKQTTLHPRNLKNAPDAYEAEILRRLAEQPAPARPISELVDNGAALRLVDPIDYERECLKCHGEPAGEGGYFRLSQRRQT